MSRNAEAQKVIDKLKVLSKKDEILSFNKLRIVAAIERMVSRLESHPTLARHHSSRSYLWIKEKYGLDFKIKPGVKK